MTISRDWTVDTYAESGGTAEWVYIRPSTDEEVPQPIEGNQSVLLNVITTGTAERAGIAIYPKVPPHHRGLLTGKIRIYVETLVNESILGIYCCASTDAGIVANGSAYILGLVGATNVLTIGRTDSGLTGEITTLKNTHFGIENEHPKVIQLEWRAGLSEYGGTQLLVSAGNQNDLRDLTLVDYFTDTDAPLLTSAGEGVFAAVSGTTQTVQAILDLSKVIELSLQ